MFKGRAPASGPNIAAQRVRDTEQFFDIFFVEVEPEGKGLFSARDVGEEYWERFLPQGRHLQQSLRSAVLRTGPAGVDGSACRLWCWGAHAAVNSVRYVQDYVPRNEISSLHVSFLCTAPGGF